MKVLRGHIPWSNVDRRLRSMREIWIATASPKNRPDASPIWFWWDGAVVYVDRAYAEKYVAQTTGERATIFVADDHVYRVRPRLVSAWSYANASTRTDWT